MRLPRRMISTCGISRSFWKMYSRRRSVSIIGSPPERMTSRTSGWLADVLEGAVVLVERDLLRVADLPAPGAEAAVGGADRAHEEQHAVGIAVRDVRDRAVAVLVERVDHAVDDLQLLDRRDVLLPDRVVDFLDEIEDFRRDPHLEVVERGSAAPRRRSCPRRTSRRACRGSRCDSALSFCCQSDMGGQGSGFRRSGFRGLQLY